MSTIHRGFRYKLQPTPQQEEIFWQYAGVTRLVYNIALEQREIWGRRHNINFAQQGRELTQLRAAFDWVRDVSVSCPQYALRDLDHAFRNFFAGRAKYPTYRKRGVGDSFRFQGREIAVRPLNGKWSAVRLPKIGWVKFRDTRPTRGICRSVAVGLDALGWHVSFACEIEHDPPAPSAQIVGIDRGVATTLALSTGETLTMPSSLELVEGRKRRAQRIVARRKRGSNRRRRAQARVARLQARQARIRRDFHHRAALGIAQRFGMAVLEDLDTRSMTASAKGSVAEPGRNVRQKAGLNRAILNAAWGHFQTILTYKMQERGGRVVNVPAHFTSQTCSACGTVNKGSRESQARFKCVECGHADHADVNAALIIERRGRTSFLDVEGSLGGPVKRQPEECSHASENL